MGGREGSQSRALTRGRKEGGRKGGHWGVEGKRDEGWVEKSGNKGGEQEETRRPAGTEATA